MRKEKGHTLHQVAMEVDIDSPMLSKIERGERFPTLEHIKKLSKYLKTSESYLIEMLTAEKIIKEYGVKVTTYNAVKLVKEKISPYLKKNK